MILYNMRHGTTDWNEVKKLQGASDIPLNDAGRELARVTAEGLKDVKFDYIFSSPLSRAYESAQIVAEGRGVEVVKDMRLREAGFGINEGRLTDERVEGWRAFFKDPDNYVPCEGGETFEQLNSRTKDFIDNVLVPLSIKEPDACVLVSGHGAMNKSIMFNLLHRELKDFWAGNWQYNCSVNIYEIRGNQFKLLEDGKIFYEI